MDKRVRTRRGHQDQDVREFVKECVQSIVQSIDPERIILFGSAARNEMHADSDLDFLIVKSNYSTTTATTHVYKNLPWNPEMPTKDIFVVTPDDITKDERIAGSVINNALREGQTLYERRREARPAGRVALGSTSPRVAGGRK